MTVPYETFDIDLREGKAREGAFVHVLLRSHVEHKRDKKAEQTGNIAIEFEYKCDDGEIRPSGISITTARYMVTEYAPENWLLNPTEEYKALARRAIKDGRHKWIGDGNNHHCALVPFGWFARPKLNGEG